MARDELTSRFEAALNSQDSTASLEQLARTLKDEGMSQAALYRLFGEYQASLDGDDPRYDAVVDVMDLICGGSWARGRALFDHEQREDEVS